MYGCAGGRRGRRRRRLDDEPRVHHVDPLGHPGDDPEVVGDEDERGPGLGVRPAEELEDLGLDRDVEGRRRLVRDHELGLEGEGHRDHHALAHAAGELVRERLSRVSGLGMPTIARSSIALARAVC